MWAWAGIILGGVLLYMYHKQASSSSASTTTPTTATVNSGGTDIGSEASQIPQFVNQTYTTVTPPTIDNNTTVNPPPVTVNVPAPAPASPAQPAYGQAGPPNSNYQAITPQEAEVLESSNNVYNPANKQAQRPYIWNGTAYVPNTNPINPNYQYYAGPLETQEINNYVAKNKTEVPANWKA